MPWIPQHCRFDMSISPGQFIARVVFWRYRRGSWQYDILCGLIILFIFLTPKSVFDGSYFRQDEDKSTEAVVIETDQEIFDSNQELKKSEEKDSSEL